MPKFYLRVGGGNAYVKGLADGQFCTWQASQEATDALVARGYGHGSELPDWLFFDLLEQGHLYTGGAGLGPQAPLVIRTPSAGCGCGGCAVVLFLLGGSSGAGLVSMLRLLW